MTVQELIEQLQKLPKDATVNIWAGDQPENDIAKDPVDFSSHTWNGEVFADITCK